MTVARVPYDNWAQACCQNAAEFHDKTTHDAHIVRIRIESFEEGARLLVSVLFKRSDIEIDKTIRKKLEVLRCLRLRKLAH